MSQPNISCGFDISSKQNPPQTGNQPENASDRTFAKISFYKFSLTVMFHFEASRHQTWSWRKAIHLLIVTCIASVSIRKFRTISFCMHEKHQGLDEIADKTLVVVEVLSPPDLGQQPYQSLALDSK